MTTLSDPPLRIRPLAFDDADFEALTRWLNEEEVVRRYQGKDRLLDEVGVRAEYAREGFERERVRGWILECEGRPIGYLQTYRLADDRDDPRVTSREIDPETTEGLDLFIGEPAFRGQGHGVRALRLICGHLFAEGATAVSVDPFVTNTHAIGVYQRAGFEVVTELPHNELFEGEWHDALLMLARPEATSRGR